VGTADFRGVDAALGNLGHKSSRGGGKTVGRETKFGLLVGVVFIVLFGVILSSRAGSTAQDHASLPVGESQLHQKFSMTDRRTDVPYTLVVPPPSEVTVSVEPTEERLPAPEEAPVEKAPVVEPPVEVGMVAFGPAGPAEPPPADTPDARRNVAPKEPPAAPPPSPGRSVHKVARGDTLTSIARQYFGKEGEGLWKKIHEANKDTIRDVNRLVVGQELVIPGLPADTVPRKEPAREVAPDTAVAKTGQGDVPSVTADDLGSMLGGQSDLVEHKAKPPATYTVKAGDTFRKIATERYGDAKLARLLILKNKHLVPDERKLMVGQRIVLLEGVPAIPAADMAVAKR